MSDVVIRAEGLGKKYLVGHESQQERYTALRDVVGRTVKGFVRSGCDMLRGRQLIAGDEVEEFWALKDVSFEIKRGDVVGIIGRNGAGKSTLLKILSRITEPSAGRVEIKGRVASLLEVGTGFHPELTGRENIFLNGAILGMSRGEIKRKFDEIVAFAEVERFLDTPVKRYSSGMYVRLAFAVAAHLEPEILVVDEVLAVGDAEFQKKCLGKMGRVAKQGRTVLFVSHNIAALQTLCSRGILLVSGRIQIQGAIADAVGMYIPKATSGCSARFNARTYAPTITGISIDENAMAVGNLVVAIDFQSPREQFKPYCGIVISSTTGVPVWGSNPRVHPYEQAPLSSQRGRIYCTVRSLPILSGTYVISVWLGDWTQDFDIKLDALTFEFSNGTVHPKRSLPAIQGYLEWPALWKMDQDLEQLYAETAE